MSLRRFMGDLERLVNEPGYIMTLICPYYDMTFQCLIKDENDRCWWAFPDKVSGRVGADLSLLTEDLKRGDLIAVDLNPRVDEWLSE